jgi:hypothetical protein
MKGPIIHVYSKDGKIKVLSFRQALGKHNKLMKEGWIYTAVLNILQFIQYLHNECKDVEEAVKELSIQKSE